MLGDKDDFEKHTSSSPEDMGTHWNTPYISAWHGLPAGVVGPLNGLGITHSYLGLQKPGLLSEN